MTTIRQKLREAGIVLALLVAAVMLLRQSARHPGDISALDRGLLLLISPAQSALSISARGVAGVAGRYVDLVHVRGQNESLRTENSRIKAELLDARRAVEENRRLTRLLGLRDTVAAESLVARVIAIDASPHFRVARVQLDRGEGEVKRGMPVITPDGVVGRINRVAGETSDIQLAVDPRFAVDVFLPRTGGRGVLKGKPGENGYRCSIEYLQRGAEAQPGDLVVTSGLVASGGPGAAAGSFPRDIPVGRISKVNKSSGLYQDVEVTPEVDFARLSEVLIVVAPPPAADPEANTRRSAAPPARGPSTYR